MSGFQLTDAELSDYHRDGFVIVENFLKNAWRGIAGSSYDATAAGSRPELPDDDVYSAIVHSESLVNAMEQLLEGEVYHYHHKMILKEPLDGGAWAWHQDYGYWYNYCCPFPLMASCMIAVDQATRENGCLQVIRESHLMGRIDHGPVGDQTGADPERVQVALDRMERLHVELKPGSAVLFHCNLLHRSDQNKSENPRWAFICCYNAARNDPFKTVRHPRYTPLAKWSDDRILEVGHKQWENMKATQT
jgi:hypothetical protein